MNYLKDKQVYLCGPITAASDDGKGWRNLVTEIVASFGVNVLDPTLQTSDGIGEVGEDKQYFKGLIHARNYELCKEKFFKIVRKDLRAVDKSDFLIFYYDPDLQMVGSVHELVIAHWQRKPILMYVDPSKEDKINPWILTFIKNGCMFTDWEKLRVYLQDIDNGKFNTSYWSL